jgi:hypothetical protein
MEVLNNPCRPCSLYLYTTHPFNTITPLSVLVWTTPRDAHRGLSNLTHGIRRLTNPRHGLIQLRVNEQTKAIAIVLSFLTMLRNDLPCITHPLHDREPQVSGTCLQPHQYKKPIPPSPSACLPRPLFRQTHAATTQPPLSIMVAIHTRDLLSRAVGVLRTSYYLCLGKFFFKKSASLRRSSSLLQKRRTYGHIKRKRYGDSTRGKASLLVPGGFPKGLPEKNEPRQHKACNPEGDYKPMDCDRGKANEPQTGPLAQEQRGQQQSNPTTTNEELIMREYNSLMADKSWRKGWFEATGDSERVKEEAPQRNARFEREKREAERQRKVRELERREQEERTNMWQEKRLAQLEREKDLAQSELARERLQRRHSRLQRAFQEQKQRRKDEDLWKQRLETNAKVAAEREGKLLIENATLRGNLRATDNALRRACNEREYVKQEMEEERVKRLRAEEDLRRWKELMKEHFPGGQHPQPQPEQPPSVQAQFQLYESKWAVLRSGVELDGSGVRLISFHEIPWPVINMTLNDPSQIRPEHIQEFVMHPLRVDAQGKSGSKRMRVRDELLKWHSDKFDSIVLPKVREEHKAAAVKVAGMIARVLTEMLS